MVEMKSGTVSNGMRGQSTGRPVELPLLDGSGVVLGTENRRLMSESLHTATGMGGSTRVMLWTSVTSWRAVQESRRLTMVWMFEGSVTPSLTLGLVAGESGMFLVAADDAIVLVLKQ